MPDNKTTLLVIYDPANARALNRALSRETDIAPAKVAPTFEAARQSFNDDLVQVVVTDWTEVNGRGVVDLAKENGVEQIIVLDGGLAPKAQLHAEGVTVLDKPFSLQDLIAAVRGQVSKSVPE